MALRSRVPAAPEETPLPQDLGTAHNLPDLILSAGRLRLGVGQIACGANGITPIGAQTPDGILDAAQDGQMGALMWTGGRDGNRGSADR